MNKEKTLEQLEIARQIISDGLEWERYAQGLWVNKYGSVLDCVANEIEIRIKPEPDKFAELKKAHAEGKIIQCKYPDAAEYRDLESPKWDSTVEYYRIKPEPVKVPLGPEDVPPSCVVTSIGDDETERDGTEIPYFNISPYNKGFFLVFDEKTWVFKAKDMMNRFLINRSIPLTGKWNPEAWEPCYKEVEQ